VHVCRMWRFVVFGSPIRLDLRLICTEGSPVRKSLDVWPAFPLVLRSYTESKLDSSEDSFDNLVAALEHYDRVRQIDITNPADSLWKKHVTAMDEPFTALRSLCFDSLGEAVPLPDTFLNGSYPCLQYLDLSSLSFPSLPRLLLSTSDLTYLRLFDIPNSGYISPETMATCLSALPKLKSLFIHFRFQTPHPQPRNRPVPPQTRSVLPALTELTFKGVSEYLEVLVGRIDAPLLDDFTIVFFYRLVFYTPQIIRFFGHLDSFRSPSLDLVFNSREASLPVPSRTKHFSHSWRIYRKRFDWKVFSLLQICSRILPFRDRSSVNVLNIVSWSRPDPDNMDPTLWLQLFHSFPSVQKLQIHVALEPFIAAALQGLTGESAANVLPSLYSLSFFGDRSDDSEAAPHGIQSFIAARQHSGHPVDLIR
jgi:hypothetical protein